MYRQWMFLAGTVIIPFLLFGNIPILSPSTDWVELQFPGTVADYFGDSTVSNKPNSEIIGSSGHPALYTRFDDGGDSLATSGELAFRMRFSGNSGKSPFQSFIWIGLDVTLDGTPDLFLGADRTSLRIHDAGDTLNISPATTTINSTAFWSTPSTTANFNFSPVSLALEPTATNFDLDAAEGTDHFVTFIIPFAEIVNAVTSLTSVVGFNDRSTLSYLAGVSDSLSNYKIGRAHV